MYAYCNYDYTYITSKFETLVTVVFVSFFRTGRLLQRMSRTMFLWFRCSKDVHHHFQKKSGISSPHKLHSNTLYHPFQIPDNLCVDRKFLCIQVQECPCQILQCRWQSPRQMIHYLCTHCNIFHCIVHKQPNIIKYIKTQSFISFFLTHLSACKPMEAVVDPLFH